MLNTPLWTLLFAILALSGCGGEGESPYASNPENDGTLSDEEANPLWEEQGRTIRTIRTAILTPSAD